MKKNCGHCGKEFALVKKGRGRHKKYCGDDCAKAAEKNRSRSRYRYKRCYTECIECSSRLGTTYKFCSHACSNKNRARRERIKRSKKRTEKGHLLPVRCDGCNVLFSPLRLRSNYGGKRYCSVECHRFHYQKTAPVAARRRAYSAWKRHKKGNQFIDPKEVHEANDWTCAYCWRKVKRATLHKPENDDAHLEHIVPMSRGGKHELSNVTTSCRECNLKKRHEKWKPSTLRPASR